jgi:branched-chain amino acid transport system permease protein
VSHPTKLDERFDWLKNRIGSAPLSIGLIVVGVMVAVSPVPVVYPDFLLPAVDLGILTAIYGLVVLAVNLQVGHTGLINFGPHLFFGVGAYAMAMLTSDGSFAGVTFGLPVPVGLVVAVVLAVGAGLLVGSTSLQLRDDYLAIVTLAAAEIFVRLINGVQPVFGGQTGIQNVPQPIGSLAVSYKTGLTATLLVLSGLLVAAYAIVHRVTTAPYGRVLRAIRADDEATKSLGKSVGRYKLTVFILGAALAGFAGAMVPLYNGSIAPSFTTISLTVTIWIGMLMGGAGNDRAVLGGLVLIMGLRLFTRFMQSYSPIGGNIFAPLRVVLIGLVLWAVIYYKPEGIWGNPDQLGEVFTRK